MKLVIVESPSKAKTIKKYLGKDYIVKASKGHVVDLPKSKIGIDVTKSFKPTYEVTNKKTLKELKDAYKDSDELILAVDLDREGEAIAWHVAQRLGAIDKNGKAIDNKPVSRIIFNEITKTALQEAMKDPRSINIDLVNAQQARRFLDRLVGYGLSPILWKKITFGLSAGRVQSVALRLVVEKEEERNAFKSEEYWSFDFYTENKKPTKVNVHIKENLKDRKEDDEDASAKLKLDLKDKVLFQLTKYKGKDVNIDKREDAEKITKLLSAEELVIEKVEKKVSKRYPKAPFITSTLQQVSVNVLGYSAKKTMMLAQKLYESGFITYMRTDSITMSNDAIVSARKYISKNYGAKYLPSSAIVYKSKSKSAQEAHECIRPVDFGVAFDKSFTPEHQKLYNLIRNRALASQMSNAEIETISAYSLVKDYTLKANGSRVLFDGFMALNPDSIKEVFLPEIREGDSFFTTDLFAIQHFTQPPARYSEASLIKKLEELGIGRPSTYASIISTIVSRKYVEKENKYLFPTDVGIVVNKLLVKYFNSVVDYGFTSGMENNLDDIAEGKLDWIKMLKDFYNPFELEIKKNDKEIPRDEFTVLGKAPEGTKCPICGSEMEIKLGRFGRFYSCSKYPDCKGILNVNGITEEDLKKEAESEEFKISYEDAPKTEDGRDYNLKSGRYGKFWAHPDYPKVKDAQPLVLKPAKLRELYGEPPKSKDGKEFNLRSGKFGKFWAHPDYPKVKEVVRIKEKKNEDN
jgi:DNA topoisomerase-1